MLECKYRKKLSAGEKVKGISGISLNLGMYINLITSYLVRFFSSLKNSLDTRTALAKNFYSNVLNDKGSYPEYEFVSSAKKDLLSRGGSAKRLIHVDTHGAGNNGGTSYKKVSAVVRRSSVTEKQGRLLFRICRYYRPASIIELGTAAGISTMYLASGNPDAEVMTIEGNSELAAIASQNFNKHNLNNIKVLNCSFREALAGLKNVDKKDGERMTLVFIDGDHTYEATLEYFDYFRRILVRPYIILIHDIYWSGGMYKAWREIEDSCADCEIMDLFFMGAVLSM